MTQDILSLIKLTKIFSSLDEEACRKLLPKFIEFSFKKNEILFSQGDFSNYLYLLVTGKVTAYVTTDQDEEKIINEIEPGDTFGELGALSNEPRAFTVIANENSTLLCLHKKTFINLCKQYPAIPLAVIEHTQAILHQFSYDKTRKHIAILPVNSKVVLEDFAESIAKYTKNLPGVVLLSDFDSDHQNRTETEFKELIKEITKLKKPRRRILYLLKSMSTPLAKACFKKLDVLYLIANHNSPVKISTVLQTKIKSRNLHLLSDPQLILLHPKETEYPKNTEKWLKLLNFSLHHHIRCNNRADHMRLLRFVRGRATALVLGGGGTRGWVHIGVLKALQEAKIPIDIIGGTSVGGIIAGCYAVNQSVDEAYAKFYKIVEGSGHTVSWRNLTWPAISLFNAKDFTLAQMNAFADKRIEDLWIPYFCISCNFSQHAQSIHHQGLLWEKIRCSTSIPGLIPPMILEGEMHVDGGLVNNLPVDVMRKLIGRRGKIIAVELIENNYGAIKEKYNFPPILTFLDAFFSKIHLGKKYTFPPAVDTFLKSLLIGSSLRAKQNARLANILISPDLSNFKILHSDAKKAKKLIDLGYKTACEQFKKISSLNERDKSTQ